MRETGSPVSVAVRGPTVKSNTWTKIKKKLQLELADTGYKPPKHLQAAELSQHLERSGSCWNTTKRPKKPKNKIRDASKP